MSTLDTSHGMNGMAVGWALSAVLVIFFLICAVLALFWPTSALGQGGVAVFATTPGGSMASWVEGILGSIAAASLEAVVFVGVHNRLLARAPSQNP
jgi:hypothetical protein